MPYPFAHPAAVLPLARPMGRFAVPSALALGSVLPDLWYFVPFVNRADSHSLAALLWFCLPAGVLLYVLFHLLLKQPLIALVSPRLANFTCAGLPPAPWYAVLASLLVGASTHVIWDELTHANDHALEYTNWFQHANTAAGAAILAAWIRRKLRGVPAAPPRLTAFSRACILLALLGAMAISALWSADIWLTAELPALRHLLRTAGIGALEGLGVALVLYCLLFQRKIHP